MRKFLCMFLGLALLIFQPAFALAQPEIHINIPSYTLQLFDNGQLIKEYNIAVGTPYEQTPTGNYAIFSKQQYPTWYPGSNFTDRTPVPPGPDNPLGSRWMEYKTNYGIHGTNKGWDINYPVSGGCIRMHDKDAQELYEMVPTGTPVIITYETLFLTEKPDGLYAKIYPDIYQRNTTSKERLLALYANYSAKYPRLVQPLPTQGEYNRVLEFCIALSAQEELTGIVPPPPNPKQKP